VERNVKSHLPSGIIGVAIAASLAIAFAIVAIPLMSSRSTAAAQSRVDTQYFDTTMRPQDDLFRYVNGKWLDTTEIPPDRSDYGAFSILYDENENRLRDIMSKLQSDPQIKADTDEQKIRDIYASFMNEQQLEKLGIKPIQNDLDLVNNIHSKRDLSGAIATLARRGYNMPMAIVVHPDNQDSTHYVPYLSQAGLELPDRDYYLVDGDNNTYKKVREAYTQHITKLLRLAGFGNVESSAHDILKIETDIARVQWDNVTNRDPVKTYNKYEFQKLPELSAEIDWPNYLQTAGLTGKTAVLVVQQPTYISNLGKQLASLPLDKWKLLLKWKVVNNSASLLTKALDDEDFAFNGKVLSGQQQKRQRWKRALTITDYAIGEGLGKLYVGQYFPEEDKRRVVTLVDNLIKTFHDSLEHLDWMDAQTKQQAQLKLSKLRVKIGYPDKWRDYSALKITSDDLWGNMVRINEFYYQRGIEKLSQPVDRNEWEMSPQTVNAYYDPEKNEIVFPAGILQPPFFTIHRDDALNYGAIGAVIGHEISHGFDDQGRQYNGDGNLHDWWTKEDQDKFNAKTSALASQYDAYEPLPGYHINGKLTLGETIADLSGLSVAFKAYQLSLHGSKAPVIDGFTGEQRFFIGWANVWRDKARNEEVIKRLASDPHPPDRFRANGTAINLDAFQQAFDTKVGDKMYLQPAKRLSIW